MLRSPPCATRTYTFFPDLTLFRADGGLLLRSEDKRVGPDQGAAWLHRGGQWLDRVWPVSGDFTPTDAVALPDGDVVVLERYYRPLVGPKARLRLLPAAQLAGTAPWQPVLLAEWAKPYSSSAEHTSEHQSLMRIS